MPYGEMQLVAYGAQDLYLTGNPQITFFKAAYKRHTNFASEYIRQDFETQPSFQTKSRTIAKCKLGRNADLISDIYLVYDLPNIYSDADIYNAKVKERNDNFRWINNLGENIIYKTQLFIDGLLVDEQYGLWMNIWNELTIPLSKRKSYDAMIGNISSLNNPFKYYGNINGGTIPQPSINAYRLYIPLPFWFCSNPGLAVPLVALQYAQLYVHVEFNPLNDLFTLGNPPLAPKAVFTSNYPFRGSANGPQGVLNTLSNINTLSSTDYPGYTDENIFWKFVNGGLTSNNTWHQQCYLDVNYIFLDKDEREKFAQVSHEYLITQVQSSRFRLNNVSEGLKGSMNILNLNLQHPVKELIWVVRRNDVDFRNQWNNYTICPYQYNFNDNQKFMYDIFSGHLTGTAGYGGYLYDPNLYKSFYYDIYMVKPTDLSQDPNKYVENHKNEAFNQDINIMYNAKLIFNGNDRFSRKDNNFFNYVQPYKHHTTSPSPGVNVYSFALHPEDHQPSGSCNMSRISNVQLELALRRYNNTISNTTITEYEGYEVFLFAVNYNVLRIMGGMGGLAFAN